MLAGLINATKLVNKKLDDTKIVVVGAGAAGVAIAKLIKEYSKAEIIAVDSKGIIHSQRDNLNGSKQALLELTNPNDIQGSLNEALHDADIFIGVSQPALLTAEMIKTMSDDAIIFAMANPTPEIMPDIAKKAGAAIVATGRSDFPNQVNNALAFPGIFRGALDNKVSRITEEHKVAAAEVIASLVENPTPDNIIPAIGDDRLVPSIAEIIR